MSMIVYNLLGLRCHGRFYTGVISHCHQYWVSKGVAGMRIPRTGTANKILDKLFFKLRVSFDGMVIRNKVLSYSSHHIETHLDVVVEVLDIQNSFAFELCLYEESIEFWWSDIMFESQHATNFHRITTFRWWRLLVIQYHSVRIMGLQWFHIVWWIILITNHNIFENRIDLGKLRIHLGKLRISFLHFLTVGINWSLYDEELVTQLGVRLIYSTWHN